MAPDTSWDGGAMETGWSSISIDILTIFTDLEYLGCYGDVKCNESRVTHCCSHKKLFCPAAYQAAKILSDPNCLRTLECDKIGVMHLAGLGSFEGKVIGG